MQPSCRRLAKGRGKTTNFRYDRVHSGRVELSDGTFTNTPEVAAESGSVRADIDITFPTDLALNGGNFNVNGDGTVNYADLVLLQDNYGKSSAGATGTIPGPATLGLLALGAMALRRRRG